MGLRKKDGLLVDLISGNEMVSNILAMILNLENSVKAH